MYSVKTYVVPASLDEATAFLDTDPNALILGGNMWVRQGRGNYSAALDLSHCGLNFVSENASNIIIGAMTPLHTLEISHVLSTVYNGVLKTACRGIVGVQFRNSATVGGSICSRLGYSDIITVLLALDASVVLHKSGELPLNVFLSGRYPGEILLEIHLPKDERIAAYHSLRNTATDFPVLNLCAACCNDGSWRVAVGSRPQVAARCIPAEEALSANDLEGACAAVRTLKFGDCIRGTRSYREAMSSVFLRRVVEELEVSK